MPAPSEARAKAIVARLSEGNASSDEVFAAFEELDRLPPDVVRGAFEPWTGPAPDLERLDDQVRRAHRLPLRTPRLAVLESLRDADVLDAGDVAEQQLRIAGKAWDGQDLDAFERLDGERDDSFAGKLERRVLGEGGRPVYDVFLFGEGAGVFFRAGTTTVLGVIADHLVETTDRPARLAIEQTLKDAPAAPTPPPPPPAAERAPQRQLDLPLAAAPIPAAPVNEPVAGEEAVEAEEEAPAPKKKKTAAKAAKATKKKTASKAAAKPAAKKKAAAAEPKKKAAAKKKTTAKTKSSKASDA